MGVSEKDRREIQALIQQGVAEKEEGDLSTAHNIFKNAAQIAHRNEDLINEAIALIHLAVVEEMLGGSPIYRIICAVQTLLEYLNKK